MSLLPRPLALAAWAAFTAFGTVTAQAHDTWFERLAAAPEPALALGTGTMYPLQDSSIGAEYLARQGCRRGSDVAPMRPLRNTDTALVVVIPADASTCWAQLTPFEIELAPDKIELYLREVHPPQEILDAWANMHARGLAWKERFTKHARIVLRGGAAAAREPSEPSEMDMDVIVESESPFVFRVLRDGQPLPDFAVELRSERSRFGLWRRTDADGRLVFQPPLPGPWLLRGVDLRLSTTVADRFDSRFVTLAFEAPIQKGSTLKLNALSASQMPAMTVIAAEPMTNTPRR